MKYKQMKISAAFFFLLIVVSHSHAQTSVKSVIYDAYVSSSMSVWKKTMDGMALEPSKSNERELELLNYEYGYIGWCIGNKKTAEARKYIERGQQRIELLMKKSYKISMLHAYKSAFYGFEIGLNKAKAPFWGKKSIDEAKRAVATDDSNPYGHIQLGNIEYYMPAVFGGSKKEALEHYLKAEQLMSRGDVKNDWNYLSTLTLIAGAYETLGNYEKADACYRKILGISPQFSWVKNDLYPKFLLKKSKK
jgi:tetratricopeptide (TPR) repeat protein